LIWNPLVTRIATRAGDDLYNSARAWLGRLLGKAAGRPKSVICIHSHYRECQITFIFRGGDSRKLQKAHEAAPPAAAQAVVLLDSLQDKGVSPNSMIYEYDEAAEQWASSFSILPDGRLLAGSYRPDRIENLSRGLSLGIVTPEGEQQPEIQAPLRVGDNGVAGMRRIMAGQQHFRPSHPRTARTRSRTQNACARCRLAG